MDEVLKFIPPEAHWVPEAAFWSERGRQMRAEQSGRFGRETIGIVPKSYREALDRLPREARQ